MEKKGYLIYKTYIKVESLKLNYFLKILINRTAMFFN